MDDGATGLASKNSFCLSAIVRPPLLFEVGEELFFDEKKDFCLSAIVRPPVDFMIVIIYISPKSLAFVFLFSLHRQI